MRRYVVVSSGITRTEIACTSLFRRGSAMKGERVRLFISPAIICDPGCDM
jgi:hypothetical protein